MFSAPSIKPRIVACALLTASSLKSMSDTESERSCAISSRALLIPVWRSARLSLVLSWFEQKAIVILLTLLSLGVKNIVTGPTAPGFFTPDLLAVLNEKFGLRSVTTVEEDMKQLLSA